MRERAWNGLWYALAAGLLVALYIWRGGATLLFLCLLLGLLIFQGVVILLLGPRSVKIERSWLPLQPEAGEPIEVTLRIKAAGGIPVPWLLIRDKLAMQAERMDPDQEYENGSLLLSGLRRQHTVKYVITNPRRGVYGTEAVYVSYGDPLGYFKRTRRIVMDDTIYVHPSRLAAYPGKEVHPVGDEEMTSGAILRNMETSSSIERIREYLPGDPLHRIYWKGSARTGTLLARIPDVRGKETRCLWLDTRHIAYEPEAQQGRPVVPVRANFELAVQAAADLLRNETAEMSDREASGSEIELRYGASAEAIIVSTLQGLRQGLDLLAGVRTDRSASRLVIPVDAMTSRVGVIHTLITGRVTSELVSVATQLAESGVKLEIWSSIPSSEAERGTWLARLQRVGIPYVDLASWVSAKANDRGDGHASA